MTCSSCSRAMTSVPRGPARVWRCEPCGAHALTDSTLRKILPEEVWPSVWPAIRDAAARGRQTCPSCSGAMDQTVELDKAGGVRVDFCDTCRLVWLDPSEFATLPRRPPPKKEEPLSPEAAKAIVMAEMELARRAEQAAIEDRNAILRELFWLALHLVLPI